jgi:alpha-tubulin suppressor-like RCC1 family protein
MAITTTNQLGAWGLGTVGELGNNAGITSGQLWELGIGISGQLGNNTFSNASFPTLVSAANFAAWWERTDPLVVPLAE